ncbi:pentatricopeptide repeat-containing protein At2g21090-like [Actinidia eriantha]|uniref:pentatricopeptide repeat-containing protein At2g21090-like n=1 Tax=Actinidia eriantha TaxID=165200 RepID=UPI00258F184A|nr:pentatricopeptide repeat-containing protein At2g21090-like [Actinidia eriantha]
MHLDPTKSPILISALMNTRFCLLIPQLQGFAFQLCLNSSAFVGSALMRDYTHFGYCKSLCQVSDEISAKDVTSWNALILGCMELGLLGVARRAFDTMPEKNIISWTTLFCKFVHALELFLLMWKSGTHPNQFTFTSALDACAGLNKRIEAAFCIFESMPKNLVSWNSIIDSCARHGLATGPALRFGGPQSKFKYEALCIPIPLVLREAGTNPDGDGALCLHDGSLWESGIFRESSENGWMPFEPDMIVWGALLAACGLHSRLELGEFVARGIHTLQKDHPAVYSLLSKIRGEQGIWDTIIALRKMMKHGCAKKQKARSWIESSIVVQ